MAPDKALVKVGVGVGGTVGGHQQAAALEVGCHGVDQLDLHRPLTELAHRLSLGHWSRSRSGGGVQGLGHLPGAAAGQRLLGLFRRLSGLHRRLVVGGSLPHLKGDGSGGAGGQTVAQAVAVVLPGELGHPVHHLDGTLVAGGGTGPAAVTFTLVNVNDLTDHKTSSSTFAFLRMTLFYSPAGQKSVVATTNRKISLGIAKPGRRSKASGSYH